MAAPQEPFVFLSYSRADETVAQALVDMLEGSGISVRWDRELSAGIDWASELRAVQADAAAVIVLWSSDSVSSTSVASEAGAAAAAGKLIPVAISGIDRVPFAFQSLQTIDLTGWRAGEPHGNLTALVSAIRERFEPWTGHSSDSEMEVPLDVSDSESAPPSLKPAARELIEIAAAIAVARGADAPSNGDVVLACLYRHFHTELDADELEQGATVEVVRAIPEPVDRRVEEALLSMGVDLEQLARDSRRRRRGIRELEITVRAAATAGRVKGSALWSHHVVAAALTTSPFPESVPDALGVSMGDLRVALRRGIARRWPREDTIEWDDLLGPVMEARSDRVKDGFQAEPKVARDYWTANDRLETGPYAEAIARFICHRDTAPPLTIGVTAPWGAGKTSLMRMVQAELDPPIDKDTPVWTFPRISLTADAAAQLAATTLETGEAKAPEKELPPTKPVTIGDALDRIAAAPQEPVNLGSLKAATFGPQKTSNSTVPETADLGQQRWRATVWFNPWMYQTGEEVWAGFAHEIIEQITGRLAPAQRERFWLELNLRRVDRQAIRRRVYAFAIERLLPALATWLVVTAAAAISGFDSVWLGLSSVGALVSILVWGRSVVRGGRVTDAMSSLVRPPDPHSPVHGVGEAFQGALDAVFPDPSYGSKAGFLQFVQTDIRHVLDLVANSQRPLVIFVDDLDRCSPGVVAQTIEAINLFLAGQFPNVIFVLALEPAVVAAHVEVAHKELVDRLKNDELSRDWSTLGWRFLEKIVQLPLSLPAPNPRQSKTYFSSLFAPDSEEPAVPRDRIADRGRIEQQVVRGMGDGTLENVAERTNVEDLLEGLTPDEAADAQRAAFAAAFEHAFRDSDPLVQEAIRGEAIQLPARNPREIKRLLNLFRFYSFIAARNQIINPDSSQPLGATLRSVARLSTLAIRWPHLLSALARPGKPESDPSDDVRPRILLEDLEDAADNDEAWEAALAWGKLAKRDDQQPGIRAEPWRAELRDFCIRGPSIGRFARDFL